MKNVLAVVFGAFLLVFAGVANAVLVTSLPEGTVVSIPNLGSWGTGPQTFDGIVWTSTNSEHNYGSVFGSTTSYGFGSNGTWYSPFGPYVGLNSPSDTMTFTFTTPVSGVGGFMNYAPNSNYGIPVISAYDSSNNLIESYTLNWNFNNYGASNSGFFYGFSEDSATIKYFTLSNSFIAITNLTTTTSAPVPIPGALVLFGSGLLGLVGIGRKKFRR